MSAIPIVLKIFLLLRSDGISNYSFSVADTSDNTGKTSYSSVTRKASVVLCDIPVIMRFYRII